MIFRSITNPVRNLLGLELSLASRLFPLCVNRSCRARLGDSGAENTGRHLGPTARIPGARSAAAAAHRHGPGLSWDCLEGSLGPSKADASDASHASHAVRTVTGVLVAEAAPPVDVAQGPPPLALHCEPVMSSRKSQGAGEWVGLWPSWIGAGTPASLLAGPRFMGSEAYTIQGNLFKKKNSRGTLGGSVS